MDSKESQEKHQKYIDFYKRRNHSDTEYWGLGIENESYLMFEGLESVTKDFLMKNHKRERYSVDYWKNYKPDPLASTLSKLPKHVKLPVYINSYMFRKCDLLGEHKTTYTKVPRPNPKFSDETVDEYLRRVSPVFNKLFEKNVIYDGDTFEFTTFNFYKTTVPAVINELKGIKNEFINELNKRLVSKLTVFKKKIVYPPLNYGFARFITNPDNLAICNNGTYHINITLPTKLNEDGEIEDLEKFKSVHANAIRAIQWIEPFLAALYGSPDILHVLNPLYSAGSQRLCLSRYIGLGTYDTQTMEKGKLLDTFDYKNTKMYFNDLHKDSPYIPPTTTGYDFNYNKFTKHGIELRIFDYFPESHLESIMNLLVLVCQYSIDNDIPDPKLCDEWNNLVINTIKSGSDTPVKPDLYLKIYKIFGVNACYWWPFYYSQSLTPVINRIANHLYVNYKNSPVCKKMSPNMKYIELSDYNRVIKKYQSEQLR